MDRQHQHYYKWVGNLEYIDVYSVLDLFSVTSPPIQHAIKKLLVLGERGVKDLDKDLQEAIDSLVRAQEMRKEYLDKNSSNTGHTDKQEQPAYKPSTNGIPGPADYKPTTITYSSVGRSFRP